MGKYFITLATDKQLQKALRLSKNSRQTQKKYGWKNVWLDVEEVEVEKQMELPSDWSYFANTRYLNPGIYYNITINYEV